MSNNNEIPYFSTCLEDQNHILYNIYDNLNNCNSLSDTILENV
jgi:hypothetical protein